jgi:hypothetical protein
LPKLTALLLVFAWVAGATFADMRFKAAREILSIDFALGFAGYAAMSFIAIATFRHASWGWIFIVWNVVSLAVGLALALAVYHEPMTLRRILATLLLLAAIFLAE